MPRPPPHGRGLLRLVATEGSAALALGPPSHLDHRGPCRLGAGASFALGPPRPSPRWRGRLLRVCIIEAPVAWVWGPPSIWGPRRPPPSWHGGLLCVWIDVPAALARGPHSLGGRTVRCARAVHALCEKLAVLHHREFGKFKRLKGRH